MANEEKIRDNRKARRRRAGTYDPLRRPRLRGPAAPEPPPSPVASEAETDSSALFGEADEDGLRMLAALETMSSLEPDFGDDLTGEAAVTIIERAPFDAGPPRDARSARFGAEGEEPDVDAAGHAIYCGPVEEAEVEIVDKPSQAPSAERRPRKQGRPVAQRFFKALTGGDRD
jgi:hypothetical protein